MHHADKTSHEAQLLVADDAMAAPEHSPMLRSGLPPTTPIGRYGVSFGAKTEQPPTLAGRGRLWCGLIKRPGRPGPRTG